MIIIGGGAVLTRDPEKPFMAGGGVAAGDDGLILALGPVSRLRREYPGAAYVDARGGLIMPGLVDLHHHACALLSRGLEPRGVRPMRYMGLLENCWWKLDRAMNLEDVYCGASADFLDCVRNGVTTVFDQHASYGAVTGSLSEVSRAADRLGLRACLGYEVSDREGESKCKAAIQENLSFMREISRRTDSLRRGMMGMHASFTLSDRTLEACMEALPATSGCHIHVAESLEDTTHSLQTYGRSIVRRLRERGVLGRKTIAAHCTHLNWEDVQILRETDTAVVHCPESNMASAVGCADIEAYLRAGLSLGLGTDGFSSDLFLGMRTASLLCRHNSGDALSGAGVASDLLFRANPSLASRFFGVELGVLKPGAAADIIVCDYPPPTPLSAANADSHILRGVCGRSVTTTVVAGKVLMENRIIKVADEEALLSESRQQAADLWRRAGI